MLVASAVEGILDVLSALECLVSIHATGLICLKHTQSSMVLF